MLECLLMLLGKITARYKSLKGIGPYTCRTYLLITAPPRTTPRTPVSFSSIPELGHQI